MPVLVSPEKEARAKEILALIIGTKVPSIDEEQERKDKFTRILAEASIDPKSEGAVQFVYEKLGGLVRTEEEQVKAVAVKKEKQAKLKKKPIE